MGACCGGLGWGSWGSMGLVGPLVGLVLFAGVLAVMGFGAVLVLRQLGRERAGSSVPHPDSEPLEIARRRLAAGEITTEEFEEIRDRLQE